MSTQQSSACPKVFAIVGFKNSGKTTLTVRLVETFTRRGFKVATIKHAHHTFKIDDDETDSARHRRAGAGQVAIVSSKRWALVTELGGAAEPTLDETLAHFSACDVVLIEGYKAEPVPKIECRRQATLRERRLADDDPYVLAIAADYGLTDDRLPVLALDDVDAIADFISERINLVRANRQ